MYNFAVNSTNAQPPDGWHIVNLDNKKRWKNASCYLCGTRETTHEHLPADNLYVSIKRTHDMITVPACSRHNHGFSQDDERFRSIIVPYCANESPIAKALLDGKVNRANKRKPQLRKKNYDKIESFDIFSLRGIYAGTRRIRFDFTPDERSCMLRVYQRLSHAIYWHLMGKSPRGRQLKLLDIAESKGREIVDACMSAFKSAPLLTSGHPDVFLYKSIGIGAEAEVVLTWTCFFNKLSIITISYPPERREYGSLANEKTFGEPRR